MEDILQGNYAHFVTQNPKIRHIHFKIWEEILQIYILRNSKSDFGGDLILKEDLAKSLLKIRTDHLIFLIGKFSHR